MIGKALRKGIRKILLETIEGRKFYFFQKTNSVKKDTPKRNAKSGYYSLKLN